MATITFANGSRQPMFVATTSVLITLSTATVALRFYCRTRSTRYLGPDDFLMLVALVLAIALGIMNGFHVSYGTGRKFADLDYTVILVPTLKHFYAYQLVYPWCLFFIKASILALYYRIFSQTNFRYAVWVLTAIVAAVTLGIFFAYLFICKDKPSRAWTTFPVGCNDINVTYFSTAGANIVTDILIFIMPFPAFTQLKLNRRKSIALYGVFAVGGVAVSASIVRVYTLYNFAFSKDPPYDAIYILLLSQIETNVGIISASAPTLTPLFRRTLDSACGDSSHGTLSQNLSSRRSRASGHFELQSLTDVDTGSNVAGKDDGANADYATMPDGVQKTTNVEVHAA